MANFLFYDFETTGFVSPYHQVVQGAFLRVDENLQPLEDPIEYKIKLNEDVIPSPQALLTHHMSVENSADSLTEYEAIQKIHRLVNQPGTISIGYNSLSFDDDFLRFSFYRNLLPPYTHQYANQCGRMDLYPIAVMYFLFKKEALNWPEINSKLSLKLENLKAANQLTDGRSHDAMVDVEATLALARIFIKEREMWEFLMGYFRKPIEEKRLTLLKNSIALMIQPKLGPENHFQCLVMYLGTHVIYKHQVWLRLDCKDLPDLLGDPSQTKKQSTQDDGKNTRHIIKKKLGEPPFILPLNDRFKAQLHPDRLKIAEENKQWLTQQPAILQALQKHFTEFQYASIPNVDPQAGLYLNGFWTSEEEKWCQLFHAATPNEKAQLTAAMKNPILKTLATRIIGRHFRDVLLPQQIEEYQGYLNKIHVPLDSQPMVDHKGEPRLTPLLALQQIQETREQVELSDEQVGLLTELENYLRKKFEC